LSPVGSPSSNGQVNITWPLIFSNTSGCTASYKSASAGWNPVTPLVVTDTLPNVTQFNWSNSTALTAGQTYDIYFDCKPE